MGTPTNKQLIDALSLRVDAVEGALNLPPRTPRTKHFFAQKWEWIVNNKGTSLLLAVVLTGAGILINRYLAMGDKYSDLHIDARVDTKLVDVNKTLGEVKTQLTTIETTLNTLHPFIEDLVRREMDKAAALSPTDFQKRLPAVKNLLSVARGQGIAVNQNILNRLGSKFLRVPANSQEFWQASAELVSYRSFNAASPQSRQLESTVLPNCADGPPAPMRIAQVLGPQKAILQRALYENCRLTLDSEQDAQHINAFLQSAPLITFKHCLILYRGGTIGLNLTWAWNQQSIDLQIEGRTEPVHPQINGNAFEFEDCLFIFSIDKVPPPSGRETTRSLLAQTESPIKLPFHLERSETRHP